MKKIMGLFRPSDRDSSKAVKNKQSMLVLIVISCILGGVFFLMSGVEKATAPAKTKPRPKRVVIGDLVSDRDIWVARLEGQVLKMKDIAQNFKKQNDL